MELLFPSYPLRIKVQNSQQYVWDIIRKKWVILFQEERIRQLLVHHMISFYQVSPGLISVEKEIRYLDLKKRFDVVVFDAYGKPFILCEVKSEKIRLTQDILNQIARYNQSMQAPHLLLTNGLKLLFFSQTEKGKYKLQKNGWYE